MEFWQWLFSIRPKVSSLLVSVGRVVGGSFLIGGGIVLGIWFLRPLFALIPAGALLLAYDYWKTSGMGWSKHCERM